MLKVTNIVVVFVALLHVSFLVLEMFFGDKPAGRMAFDEKTKEELKHTKVPSANQRGYNGLHWLQTSCG